MKPQASERVLNHQKKVGEFPQLDTAFGSKRGLPFHKLPASTANKNIMPSSTSSARNFSSLAALKAAKKT